MWQVTLIGPSSGWVTWSHQTGQVLLPWEQTQRELIWTCRLCVRSGSKVTDQTSCLTATWGTGEGPGGEEGRGGDPVTHTHAETHTCHYILTFGRGDITYHMHPAAPHICMWAPCCSHLPVGLLAFYLHFSHLVELQNQIFRFYVKLVGWCNPSLLMWCCGVIGL